MAVKMAAAVAVIMAGKMAVEMVVSTGIKIVKMLTEMNPKTAGRASSRNSKNFGVRIGEILGKEERGEGASTPEIEIPPRVYIVQVML
ncbi:hypothetical protein BDZ91DRAFT_791714 [Kalaharituber pfeilii]|nr:hypothetical protein BDZ91DRAFT_791714 [Kalaharituber pfeilii]